PSGVRYWSVVDDSLVLVPAFDRFLFEERFARDRSEKTTAQYASGLVEFGAWASERGLLDDLVTCARNLGMFQLHLRTTPISRVGRSHGRARSVDRVADIMGCVRSFYRFQVRHGAVPSSVNELLYDVVEPVGEAMPWLEDLPAMVARPVHTLRRSGESEPQTATLEEYAAMMAAPGGVRDKFLISLLALTGLRIGQALGLRRSDLHLMENSRAVGCSVQGPHLHVVRREDNENLALSKRRRELVVPVHPAVVGVYAAYCADRDRTPAAARSDFVFVNLTGGEVGRAMTDGRAREVVAALGRRAGIDRVVTPHQFRHGLATELVESGRSLDEVQMILGHARVETTRRYARTSRERLRAAVESVALPTLTPGATR
ncbi:MAG: tyrosine-type recombinase/integrase, partial [Pseudonocardiaceae bacterium]